MLYHIENLHFTYSLGEDILQGVSFSIQEGEIFTMLGRNGAGKSTLFSCMLGLLKPSQGHVKILGHHVNS